MKPKKPKVAAPVADRRSLWTQEAADGAAARHYDRALPPPPPTLSRPAYVKLGRRLRNSVARRPAPDPVPTPRAAAPEWSARGLTLTTLPPRWRQVDLSSLTGAPRAFAEYAVARGHVVAARQAGDAVQLGVRHRKRKALWIRATWIAGRTTGVTADGRLYGVNDGRALL